MNASVKQVALADVVLLNKIDMVPSSTGVLTNTSLLIHSQPSMSLIKIKQKMLG